MCVVEIVCESDLFFCLFFCKVRRRKKKKKKTRPGRVTGLYIYIPNLLEIRASVSVPNSQKRRERYEAHDVMSFNVPKKQWGEKELFIYHGGDSQKKGFCPHADAVPKAIPGMSSDDLTYEKGFFFLLLFL